MEQMVKGTVEAVRKDQEALKIDEGWYTSWAGIAIKKAKVERGDVVSFGWIAKGPFNNIKTEIQVDGKGEGTPATSTSYGNAAPSPTPPRAKKFGEVHLDTGRCIIRQNSITNAVAFCSSKGDVDSYTTEHIINTARDFEAYSSGDLEHKKAVEVAANMALETDEE